VVGRLVKVEKTFSKQCRVRVGLSGEGGRQRWCGFNASVLTREGRQLDEMLLKDEAEVTSSS
jgi:hypothetical protein